MSNTSQGEWSILCIASRAVQLQTLCRLAGFATACSLLFNILCCNYHMGLFSRGRRINVFVILKTPRVTKVSLPPPLVTRQQIGETLNKNEVFDVMIGWWMELACFSYLSLFVFVLSSFSPCFSEHAVAQVRSKRPRLPPSPHFHGHTLKIPLLSPLSLSLVLFPSPQSQATCFFFDSTINNWKPLAEG